MDVNSLKYIFSDFFNLCIIDEYYSKQTCNNNKVNKVIIIKRELLFL